ncbi:hypothetical protein [Pollutibacter soli]|uniref:hypothetical protein n=1 Tax=Pollutibacter soli TaxID=3034157 RepID=UPI003013550A
MDIKLISAEELVYAPVFDCGYQNGKAFFSVELASGFVLSDQNVTATINRISHLPLQHVERFKTEDREYVSAELISNFAFLFSILPHIVFNNTSPSGFCGRVRSDIEWLLLAKKAGFETSAFVYENKITDKLSPVKNDALKNLLYFNGRCYGDNAVLSSSAVTICKEFGEISAENIIEIWFYEDEKRLHFHSATVHPSFHNAGTEFIDDLNSLL